MPALDVYTEATVFVLGAGASSAYGFPLGPQLKNNIVDLPDSVLRTFLEEHNIDQATVESFKRDLRDGDYGTIDYFLERKKRYRELGALCIATVIADAEAKSSLFPQRDLYADLFYLLDVESGSDSIPPVSVVTLNYDRSLEYFLFNNAEINCADEHEEHAKRKISKLLIIHAHGSLCNISDAPYGKVKGDKNLLEDAARRIRIVSDRFDDSHEFHAAQDAVASAHNIVFLGFGYHHRTLEALLAKADPKNQKIFGTSRSFADERQRAVRLLYGSSFSFGGNLDCSAFMEYLGIGRGNIRRK